MADLLIRNARVLLPDGTARLSEVAIDGAHITHVGNSPAGGFKTHIDARGAFLSPGLIDLHTHGVGTYLYERSGEDLANACAMLPRFGVTTVLPTLYRVLDRPSFRLLGTLTAAARCVSTVSIPGFHMEGPFLALAGAGAMTIAGDVGFLKELIAACDGFVRVMSISPETPGITAVIEELVARDIVPFITHTRATAEQTQRAIDAGARHATHFYDVFPIPDETEPGVRAVGAVEALLADDRCSVDFITDGVHVPPIAIRAALAAKGWDRVACITDSNIGAGLPAAEYDLPWGYRIRAEPNNGARIADPSHPENGGLAGSTLTMDGAVRNLQTWFPGDPSPAWSAATSTPARIARLQKSGSICIGNLADLVLWGTDFQPATTIHAGRVVYRSSESEGA